MLSQTGNTQRRLANRSVPRSSSRNDPRIRMSKLDREKRSSAYSCSTYVIVAGVCLLIVSVVLLIRAINPMQSSTQAPFDANLVPDLLKQSKDKLAGSNSNSKPTPNNNAIATAKQSPPVFNADHVVPNPNAVKITFRLYSTPTCDEADESGYITITKESTDVSADSVGSSCPLCFAFCGQKLSEGSDHFLNEQNTVKGVKLVSNDSAGQLDLFSDCAFTQYHSSVFAFEECVHIFDWPHTAGVRVRRNFLDFPQKMPPPIAADKLPPLQHHLVVDGMSEESKALATRDDIPSYLIVYSCESSEYCAFQAQANYYGFLTSGQHPTKAGFLRLLTNSEPDDLASYVPTFTAPRNLYSRRYSPYNKADVMVKWFESAPNRPEQYDIVVVIDPDNWVLRDITHWVVRASEGHALGEAAWFHGSHLVTELWKEVCVRNCDWELDMVGVPYIVHRNDLAKIAPYFKMYINIMKEREEQDSSFLNRYKGIQMGWGTEMFGYIFGAAHAGIKHEVVRGIQRRDVSDRPKSKEEELSIDMIHMGRAWWPPEYELSAQFMHTEGKAWSRFGTQVWCKCNYTASDIIPWPMPPREKVDFQSFHTLYLLHHGREYFGDLPSSKYRKPSRRYNEPYP